MRATVLMRGVVVIALVAVAVPAGGARAHPGDAAKPVAATPPTLSTSGDYATDVFGDPWDFSNDDDVPPIELVGSENGDGLIRLSLIHI